VHGTSGAGRWRGAIGVPDGSRISIATLLDVARESDLWVAQGPGRPISVVLPIRAGGSPSYVAAHPKTELKGLTMKIRILLVFAVVAALLTGMAPAGATSSHLAKLRAKNHAFHNIANAEQAGFTVLADQDGITCIDMPGMGGMGVHWVLTKRVGDPAEHLTKPEALVYEPLADGTLKLAAVEYVVLKADWDAHHSSRPTMFGHEFNLTTAPNRFGLPDYYSLHVWAWKHNPAGTYAAWNPDVHCH
jgi:hypothetical protein